MPEYLYKARNLKGEVMAGVLEADSVEALEYTLNDKGFFSVSVALKEKSLNISTMFEHVKKRDLAIFCRQLSVVINSGITIIEAVAIMAEQMDKKAFREVLEIVRDDLQKGKLLSQSMASFPGIFPEFLLNMIKVGEASGTLDAIMDKMADYYENEERINRKVKAAMTYPIILAILTVGVVGLLMVVVLPMFSSILGEMGGQMPGITRVLIAVSNFMVKNIAYILLVIILVAVSFVLYTRSEAGRLRYDAFKLKFPLTKTITVKVITSRFARSMGILLKSGINIINAMNIMTGLIGNRAVEQRFEQSADEVQQGYGISGSLDKIGIFPPLLIHMVSVGEKTGELDQMLTRTSGFFDEEVEAAISKMTTMIEPIMIIILGGVIGTIMLSIMLPMLSIMSSVA